MPYDVDENDQRNKASGRNGRFWFLVLGIFFLVIVIWLAFFSDTIFTVNIQDSSSYIHSAGQYWDQIKENFSNKLNEIMSTLPTATSTETSTDGQSTSTP